MKLVITVDLDKLVEPSREMATCAIEENFYSICCDSEGDLIDLRGMKIGEWLQIGDG